MALPKTITVFRLFVVTLLLSGVALGIASETCPACGGKLTTYGQIADDQAKPSENYYVWGDNILRSNATPICTRCWLARYGDSDRWDRGLKDHADFYHPLSASIRAFPLPDRKARKSPLWYTQTFERGWFHDLLCFHILHADSKGYLERARAYAGDHGLTITVDRNQDADHGVCVTVETQQEPKTTKTVAAHKTPAFKKCPACGGPLTTVGKVAAKFTKPSKNGFVWNESICLKPLGCDDNRICTRCWLAHDSSSDTWERAFNQRNDFYHPLTPSIRGFPLPTGKGFEGAGYHQTFEKGRFCDRLFFWCSDSKEYLQRAQEYARKHWLTIRIEHKGDPGKACVEVAHLDKTDICGMEEDIQRQLILRLKALHPKTGDAYFSFSNQSPQVISLPVDGLQQTLGRKTFRASPVAYSLQQGDNWKRVEMGCYGWVEKEIEVYPRAEITLILPIKRVLGRPTGERVYKISIGAINSEPFRY